MRYIAELADANLSELIAFFVDSLTLPKQIIRRRGIWQYDIPNTTGAVLLSESAEILIHDRVPTDDADETPERALERAWADGLGPRYRVHVGERSGVHVERFR